MLAGLIMYLTLLFERIEGPSEIYELCFHPAVVWMKNGEHFCQSHNGPEVTDQDLSFLIEEAQIERTILDIGQNDSRPRKVTVLCHDSGNGTEEDLDKIIQNLQVEGFETEVLRLSA